MLVTTTFTAPRTLAEAMLALTDTNPGLSLDVSEEPNDESAYRYTFFLTQDDRAAFEASLNAHEVTPGEYQAVDTSIDYIAQNRAAFPPLTIGPFFIARNDEDAPEGLIKLDIMPNRAFGSGEHATTTGCLLGYTHLIQSGAKFESGLDFGAGSGILAIAAAKQNGTPFLCIDNDAPSVAINEQNAILNGVQSLLVCEEGEAPPADKTYDLVFANILMQPLLELADELATCTSKGGSLILSGFIDEQDTNIRERYTALGMKMVWQHQHAQWLAQVWQHA